MKTLLTGVLLLAVPAAAQDAPFTWKFQPEPGSKWELRMFMNMRTAQKITEPKAKAGADKPATHRVLVNVKQAMTADYNVLSRDASGAYTVEFTYKTFSMSMDMNMDGKPAPPEAKQVMNATIGRLGKSFEGIKLTMKLSPRGEVWNILGLEQMKKKLFGALPQTGALTEGFARQFYSKESMKNLTGLNGQLPTSPLSIGQAYSYTLQLPKGAPLGMDIYGTNTLTAREDGKATFDQQGVFDIDTIDIPLDAQKKAKISIKMDGTLKGKIVVDEASGLPAESFTNVRYNGETKIPLPGQKEIMTVPLWANMEQRIVMQPRP